MENTNPARRAGLWVAGGTLALVTAGTLLMAADGVANRQTVDVVVTLVDTPRTCHGRSKLLFSNAFRSSVPEQSVPYCGLLFTDHGSVTLPESSILWAGFSGREEMVDLLQAGCRYRLTVTGFGPALRQGEMPKTHTSRQVVRVERLGC